MRITSKNFVRVFSKFGELDAGDEFTKRKNWENALMKGFQWRNRERFRTEVTRNDESVEEKWEVIDHQPAGNGNVRVRWLYFDVDSGELGEETEVPYSDLKGVSIREARKTWNS